MYLERTGDIPAISWTNGPPDDAREMAWPMLRVPAKGMSGLIILSQEMLGTCTHYFGGRTVPHSDQGCRACDEQNQKRWHGYLAVWHPKAAKKAILEITDAAADTIKKVYATRKTLRSLSIAGQRRPVKPNGTLIVQLIESEWAADGLPPSPDVRRILLRMWGLPGDEPEVNMHSAFARRKNALRSNHQAV